MIATKANIRGKGTGTNQSGSVRNLNKSRTFSGAITQPRKENPMKKETNPTGRGITEKRLKEIIKIAYALRWITPPKVSYPEMQLSEVEKCMLAMVDDFELERMRKWYKDAKT